MSSRNFALAGLVVCLALAYALPATCQIGNFPAVVVSTNGAGDFGPQTPGTQTSGIQEAFNYCVGNNRDLYIKGGPGTTYPIYNTITLPAAKNLQITGGQYTLAWNGASNADLLVINSARNCNYSFGVLQYSGMGAALRVKPVAAIPSETSAAFTDSEVNVGSIEPTSGYGGTGVLFDTTSAAIQNSKFTFFGIKNYATCLNTPFTDNAFAYNFIKCLNLHSNIAGTSVANIGEVSRYNDFKLGIGADNGAANVTGVRVAGDNNTVELLSKGGFAANSDLIFAAAAEGNRATIIYPNTVTDPTSIVGDSASNPTNRVIWIGGHSTLAVRTVTVATPTFTYMPRLYPVVARITGGVVSSVKLIRGITVDYGNSPGDILLNVGDQLQISSSSAPTLTIIPQPGN